MVNRCHLRATNSKAEYPVEHRIGPENFLATISPHQGFDAQHSFFPDHAGRPTSILNDGQAIPKLVDVARSNCERKFRIMSMQVESS